MEDLYKGLLDCEFQCQCGRKHYVPIKKVIIANGVLDQFINILLQLGYKNNFHLVSDKNTYKVAGNKIEQLLNKAAIKYSKTIFNEDSLEANMVNVALIKKDISNDVSLIIAIGSGTINDLSRYAAFQLDIPYIVFATAPSMDGYASSVSPLIENGFKNTYTSVPPMAIIADSDILKAAPPEMIAAGFGDLVGKYISLTDWKLSKCVNNEYYCEYVAQLVQKSLSMCVDQIENLKKRDDLSITNLMDGLVLSGLGMLMVGNSRPASGAEHHLSHYWEMQFLMRGRKQLLHGQKVGVSSVLMAKLYHSLQFVNINNDNFSTLRIKTTEERKDDIRLNYGGIADSVIQENFSEMVHQKSFSEILEKWKEILEIAKSVPDAQFIKSLLDYIGAPSLPEQLDIDEQLLMSGMGNCMYVRKRYTILRLFDELGLRVI